MTGQIKYKLEDFIRTYKPKNKDYASSRNELQKGRKRRPKKTKEYVK